MNKELTTFIEDAGAGRNLRVEENLGSGFVKLKIGEAERRQAKHDIQSVEDIVIEMLRNSRDANAQHIFIATSKVGTIRTITIIDDGDGIPKDMQERIFDARVTSKLESMHVDRWGVHGRGMALFSIKENSLSSHVVYSDRNVGAVIQVVCDTTKLSEKTDQSTWPVVSKNSSHEFTLSKGPHNIIRTICDFAINERNSCKVYIGSPSEIIVAIRSVISTRVSESDLLFDDSFNKLPVVQRVVLTHDLQELRSIVALCGFEISDRTLHRVLSGKITPAPECLQTLRKLSHTSSNSTLYKGARGLKLSPEDIQTFQLIMEKSFKFLGDRYFIELENEPKVRVSKSKITITFDISDSD